MRVTVFMCDGCGQNIEGPVYQSANSGDLCGTCIHPTNTECPHEENVSDAVPGRDTARLICKACGYDREERVA